MHRFMVQPDFWAIKRLTHVLFVNLLLYSSIGSCIDKCELGDLRDVGVGIRFAVIDDIKQLSMVRILVLLISNTHSQMAWRPAQITRTGRCSCLSSLICRGKMLIKPLSQLLLSERRSE